MVDDEASYARRTGSVKVDGSHRSGVVGQEEVAVDSREHGYESQWLYAKTDAERIKGAHGGSLREQHDGHDEEGDGEEEGILRHDGGDVSLEELQVAVKECVAHPCNAEYCHHCVHARAEHVALDGVLHVGFADKEDESRRSHHYYLDGLRHGDVVNLAVHHEGRTERRYAAEDHHQQHA